MVSIQTEMRADVAPAEPKPPSLSPLEDAAIKLAQSQTISYSGVSLKLPMLAEPNHYEGFLQKAYSHFARIAEEEFAISYAGEWLLDNYYIVQQAFKQTLEDMPDSFYRELPTLATTPLKGYPRAYGIARQIIRAMSSNLAIDAVEGFLEAYQRIAPLTMGELWALPALLRIGILENLEQALSRLMGLKTEQAADPDSATAEMADETVVANCIMSLRWLGIQDWKQFFEDVSRVEQILRSAPHDVYAEMDFDTRNRCREAIEELATEGRIAEEAVAQRAVELAEQAYQKLTKSNQALLERTAYVSYYLLDKGRLELEAALNYRPSLSIRTRRWIYNHAELVYIGGIVILTALITAIVVNYAIVAGGSVIQIALAGLLSVLPASAVVVSIVNWLVSCLVPPRTLPKLDFSQGIPDQYSTMVVIPALLPDEKEIQHLLQELELHYLRNPHANLSFVLLADFTDAPQEHLPADDPLIDFAIQRIYALNEKYQAEQQRNPFYFFCRKRQWNEHESCWMGWERKRGKLAEFNRLLLNPDAETSYTVKLGDLRVLPQIRYVITLDADTVLPRDSAPRLVGTLAHPLNRAEFAPNSQQVIAGYTILQPRVEINPTAANKSPFTRIFAGDTGLDLYTLAVSDVYQDFFSQGVFVGKGIYDVAAFERSLEGLTPENALLSHDLFEGIHGRAGLVSDIVLFEDYPPFYLAHMRRLHRWIRGDWQLLPWLMPTVPHETQKATRNTLSALSLWKIIDNLRRSLVAPSILFLLLAGWLILPGSALIWTTIALLMSTYSVLTGFINHGIALLRGALLNVTMQHIRTGALRWLLSVVFLPYNSLLSLDAIVTTLVRLVKRKRLLQWTTAAHTVRLFGSDYASELVWNQMLLVILFAGIAGLIVGWLNPVALPAAALLILVWLGSPQIAYWISRPIPEQRQALSSDEERELRMLSRRTWLYFEEFVGPVDHWLPPDHFQKAPRTIVAHQTSPTNIGLLLLTTLAAYDSGYIGPLDLALRLRSTFDALDKLERYRGHFLNWYNTETLTPLRPRYVSTVDSGNLAGCLLALQQGITDLLQLPILRRQRWQGILDEIAVMCDILDDLGTAALKPLQTKLTEIEQRIMAAQDDPTRWASLLTQLLTNDREELGSLLLALMDEGYSPDFGLTSDFRTYLDHFQHDLSSMQRDMEILLPWLPLLTRPPALVLSSDTDPAVRREWKLLVDALPGLPPLGDITGIYRTCYAQLHVLKEKLGELGNLNGAVTEAQKWCDQLMAALDVAMTRAQILLIGFEEMSRQAETYFQALDFTFLYNDQRRVFHIGYNVDTETLDNSFYDLLASEARLSSLIAIAKGNVPQKHWLNLARPITQIDGAETLLSWSGTMFEYLMPMLLMRAYKGTLLDQSYTAAVKYQIDYGQQHHVPWGISESGYYAFDSNMNYQYRAFGVPGLAFKRGMGDDLVIAPYASIIALPVQPHAAIQNIGRFKQIQALSTYGLYEAVDYTGNRLPLGQKQAIVQEYMAHHQGMIFLTVTNFLHDDVMIQRFHADPRIQSVDMLLQEQIPQQVDLQYPSPEQVSAIRPPQPQATNTPWRVQAETPLPEVHFLSNGRYSVLITNSGGGYSQWQDMALTRWRADSTLDNHGLWIYAQDVDSGALWSVGVQPTAIPTDTHNILFYPHKAEFHRRDNDISLLMELTVPPDDDLEIRRITITNHSDHPRRIRLTSYAEVILSQQLADLRHPAFNKMFIESEYLPDVQGLLFRRRPRSSKDEPIFMIHMLVVEAGQAGERGYETNRANFLTRGRTPRYPAMHMTGEVGATLDPIMALGQEITLDAHGTAQVAYMTLAGSSRQALTTLANNYRSWSAIEQAFEQARYQSELELRHLALNSPELERIQRLLAALLYPNPGFRAEPGTLAANNKAQPGLWAYGISGDYPILLVSINDETEIGLIRDVLQAHVYWRNRQIKVTLVILNQRDSSYNQELYQQLYRLILRMGSETWLNRHDGIFILRHDLMDEVDRVLIRTAARVFLDGKNGLLDAQLAHLPSPPMRLPAFTASLSPQDNTEPTPELPRPTDLVFDNGVGGFTAEGREYVIYLGPEQTTPAPWVNVIANPEFGFTVSESGSGYTWANNSGENRLTLWRNDPVIDLPGEALYLRDEETAEVWSPTPLPAGDDLPYLIRHGAGYSSFEHNSHGLKQCMIVYAASDAPAKIVRLRLENTWSRVRRITVTYYAEWVLGPMRDIAQQYVVPEYDSESSTLLARNPYSIDFGNHVAFLTANKAAHGLTADRTEFLGRLGGYRRPAGLIRIGLASTVQAGLDPCAVLQLHVDLQPGASEEVYFVLGQGQNRQAALDLANRFKMPGAVDEAWQGVAALWDEALDSITIQTPDPALNLIPRWLLYQTLSCRIWGRSALYQSSGAFGFRDQLQDVMAVMQTRPDVARDHIMRAAKHQFEAGDVLHWWHPPLGRGVRTRFSDDLLWLPFVVAEYVAATGDSSILNEKIPFLRGEALKPDEEERYGLYEATTEGFSIYEHCRRALAKGITTGAHGLPLMGSGDWNDGMNRVGIEGKGESIWMGWFLCAVLKRFAPICEMMGDGPHAAAYLQKVADLTKALETHAWDGKWYLRAFYDDGSPLGSAKNQECRIDSIAQSWGVISGAAQSDHAQQAMQSVVEMLVKEQDQLLLLFTPPFDKTKKDPGYIKGYVPGIRENGGQYTHAALWTVWAFALMGDGDRAEGLFRLLNPVYHADTPDKLSRYRVEPYVVAADVYSAPHAGRGGWTWYTGSSGWMYRLVVEMILGLRRTGNTLQIDPCIPKAWPEFAMAYRFGKTAYQIQVKNPSGISRGVTRVRLDGQFVPEGKIPLEDDGKDHQVVVEMGATG